MSKLLTGSAYFAVPIMLIFIFCCQACLGSDLVLEKNPYFGSRVLPPLRSSLSQGESTWEQRRTAEYLFPAAKELAEGRLSEDQRRATLAAIISWLDSLLEQSEPSGTWWDPARKNGGDPNVNRFVLLPILDTIFLLRGLPEVDKRFDDVWKLKLKRAIDFQFDAYSGKVQWDWAALAKGQYPNQDIYTALIMALSDRIFRENRYKDLANELIRSLETNLLPNGAFHYIGQENESPLYHAVVQMILGRYYEITQEPAALRILKLSAEYWLLTLSAEGIAEAWSDVWWKQQWAPIPDTALSISAAVTNNPQLNWHKWQLLKYQRARGSFGDAYGAYWWRTSVGGTPPPPLSHIRDENIRGSRGRNGSWYYGVTQGRGLRNTFVGAMISTEKKTQPLEAAFRGAQIEVKQKGDGQHGHWLSQLSDVTAHAMIKGSISLLGAQYTLQPSIINGVPQPITRSSPWQVTQLWGAGPEGLFGTVSVVALEDNDAISVIGRILAGPSPVIHLQGRSWRSGPLKIVLYRQFGTTVSKAISAETSSPVDSWGGIEFEQPIKGMKKGDRFEYIVWIGPDTASPPDRIQSSADSTQLTTTYQGRPIKIRFDPSTRKVGSENQQD